MEKHTMSNDELVAALATALRQESGIVARVITMLAEVEERRLYLELACPSMFEFCIRRLGMSEGAAYRRIAAARLAKEFPPALEAVRTGQVHLSGLVALREVITAENADALLTAAAGKTKRAIEELVARLAPKPDACASIRRMPQRHATAPAASMAITESGASLSAVPTASTAPASSTPSATAPIDAPAYSAPATAPIPVRAQITPLAESRHKVQFTASTVLRQKLERAQSLMRHRNVEGDLAVIVERAVDLLITKLEKEKLAATSRPKPRADATANTNAQARAGVNAKAKANADASATPNTHQCAGLDGTEKSRGAGGITAEVRREVVQRDGEQCAFVSPNGDRCASRDFLELDHSHPRALGGSSDAVNLRLLCRAHNQYAAERIFGREHMARAIRLRQQKKLDPTDQARLPIT